MRLALAAITASLGVGAHALNAQSLTAEEALASAQATYSADSVSTRCRPASGDEIVVCADRGGDQRVPSTADSDPGSRAASRARNGGIPRAPQVGPASCLGEPGCIRVGSAPPPLYLIDLKTIPLPPEGSDADLIAKGEKRAP